MINIAFEGGLGNQMFQYVYARYLEEKFQEPVKYDVSKYKFEANECRNFELQSFNIRQEWQPCKLNKNRFLRFGPGYGVYLLVTAPYIRINNKRKKQGKNYIGSSLYQKIINTFGFYRVHYGEYEEPNKSLSKTKYVRGHWFWTDLVQRMDHIVREELRVITPVSIDNQEILDQMKVANSVGVHIRRGDYVQLGLVICDIAYYTRCMKKMTELVDNPTFFVFSDDIPWVKENLKPPYNVVFVDNNNSAPEDMRLLYSCNHFIMSNSTFSWWGAYLGDCPDKKVIVPEIWSKGGKKSKLILEDWIVEKTI